MFEENRSSNEIIGVAIEVHTAQVLTYLKLSEKRLGLLLNFHVKTMKQGIKRVVL
jgi:GxxExxY protein